MANRLIQNRVSSGKVKLEQRSGSSVWHENTIGEASGLLPRPPNPNEVCSLPFLPSFLWVFSFLHFCRWNPDRVAGVGGGSPRKQAHISRTPALLLFPWNQPPPGGKGRASYFIPQAGGSTVGQGVNKGLAQPPPGPQSTVLGPRALCVLSKCLPSVPPLLCRAGGKTVMGEPIMAASRCSAQSGWVVIHYRLMFSCSMQTTEAGRNHSWEESAWQRQ